jgi:hypothetical protein
MHWNPRSKTITIGHDRYKAVDFVLRKRPDIRCFSCAFHTLDAAEAYCNSTADCPLDGAPVCFRDGIVFEKVDSVEALIYEVEDAEDT